MTSFAWWAHLAPVGRAMCCLCFEAKLIEEFWVDGDGVRWDVCQECKAIEDAMILRRSVIEGCPTCDYPRGEPEPARCPDCGH